MLRNLIDDHLNKINKVVDGKASIIIYKGFPTIFIKEIAKRISPINPLEGVTTNDKIDLSKIIKISKETIKKLLNIADGLHIMTYEEAILLSDQIKLSTFDLNFIICVNNLTDLCLSDLNYQIPNIDAVVEKADLTYKEDILFNDFYVYSTVKFNLPLIQYRDIPLGNYENVTTRDFFDDSMKMELNYQTVGADKLNEGKHILATDEDRDYILLKYGPFIGNGEKLDKNIEIFIDQVTLKNEELENQLKILKFIYAKNLINLNLKLIVDNKSPKYRDEFKDILQKYWKSDNFRDLFFYQDPSVNNTKIKITQGSIVEEIVLQTERAMEGNDFSDIFITAPTGAGKSVLFQIPAFYIATKYKLVTIIVSPLKALMYDQVKALREKGINFAAYINSDISLIEREKIINDIKNGKISILYLSPELLLSYDIRTFIGERKIGLLVIDEAHLVTTWGRDFRVDYWYLGTYIKRMRKYIENSRFPVLALTATAIYMGPDDIVFQTVESLNMQAPKLYIGNVRRDSINFEIRPFSFKGSHEMAKIEKTKEIIINNIKKNQKTIVYFPWTNQIKLMMNELPEEYRKYVGIYYGDVERTTKQITYDNFQNGEILVVLATKAFGMGIDVSDIEIIYHHAPSGSLADYIQEIGRVARDNKTKGCAIMDFCDKDLKFTKILYGLSSLKQYQLKFTLQKLMSLYEIKESRQMLVSVEDFEFIFGHDDMHIETKVKSALLLLEKDLRLKVNNRYDLIIVRPKAMFSTVYACIPKEIEKEFLTRYGPFCRIVSSVKINKMNNFVKNSSTSDCGDIFEMQLDKIWGKFFNEDSFPMIKKKFFDRQLFPGISNQPSPRYKLTVLLNDSPENTLKKIEEIFSCLDKIFNEFKNETFTEEELKNKLKEDLNDEILSRRISNLITNLYTTPQDFSVPGQRLDYDTFITSKRNNLGENVYKLVGNRYLTVRAMAIRKFSAMFDKDSSKFEKYISINDMDGEFRIKIAYLIESLLLGSYEITGGKLSQIYIRINEPYKLKLFSLNEKYTNVLLQDIDSRHDRSVKVMETFFTKETSNLQKWDFIEDYFLGKLNT